MNARHTPSLESLLERHREGGAFPTYAELSAIAAPAAPSEQAEPHERWVLRQISQLNPANPDHHAGAVFMAREGLAAAAAPAAPLPAQLQQSECIAALRAAAAELERQGDLSLDMRPEFRRAIANIHAALAAAGVSD